MSNFASNNLNPLVREAHLSRNFIHVKFVMQKNGIPFTSQVKDLHTSLSFAGSCEHKGQVYGIGESWMTSDCYQCVCMEPFGVGCCDQWVCFEGNSYCHSIWGIHALLFVSLLLFIDLCKIQFILVFVLPLSFSFSNIPHFYVLFKINLTWFDTFFPPPTQCI